MHEAKLSYYRVIDLVPITNEKCVIISWFRERNGNPWPAKDFDGSKTTSCFVESKRWKIEEASNLIFDLKCICEVFPRRDGTCGSINSVLVRISPLLNTIPIPFQYEKD